MTIESLEPTAPFSPNARLRFDVVRGILNQVGPSGSFLEIGCGQGALASILTRHFEYVGYEPDPVSFQTAFDRLERLRSGKVVNDVLPGEADRSFDFVGAFEVLEHLEDDLMTLTELVRWLRTGGHAIVSVPAHPDRFGPADMRVGHFRRYTRESIHTLLRDAGLIDVQVVAYGFPLGYLLDWARNRIASRDLGGDTEMKERTAESGRFLQPLSITFPLIWAGTWPFVVLQRPFAASNLGTGWIAHGRRP